MLLRLFPIIMYKRWALNYNFLIFDFKDGMKYLGSRYTASIIILINFSMAYAKLIKIMMLTAACYIIWIYSHSYFNSYILCLALILGLHEDKTTHNVNDIKWSKDANLVKEKYVSLLFLFNAPLLQNGILYEYFTTWHYASFSRACQMCKILVI